MKIIAKVAAAWEKTGIPVKNECLYKVSYYHKHYWRDRSEMLDTEQCQGGRKMTVASPYEKYARRAEYDAVERA